MILLWNVWVSLKLFQLTQSLGQSFGPKLVWGCPNLDFYKSRVEIMKCNIWISDIYFSSCLFSTRLHSSLLSGDYLRAINSYCRRVKWSNFDAYYMQHMCAKISKNVYHWKLGNFLRFYRQYPVTLCQNKIKFYLNIVNGWYLDKILCEILHSGS